MTKVYVKVAAVLGGVIGLAFSPAASAGATLIRFPSASEDAIAFVAHGDLWIAARDGGSVRRLVRSSGRIVAARISPDGRWVAYTERAHGGQDVYAVAVAGGVTRRLTFDLRPKSSGNLVVAWTPNGRDIVFLSDRSAWAFKVLQAFSVPLDGGEIRPEPLGQAGRLSFSPDGLSIAYTRTFTDLASRKRYLGGQAEDIFTYDLAERHLTRVTDWKGTDTAPMWSGRSIYFVSDRGAGSLANIWRYDLDSRAVRQITHFADYDVDWPALGGGRIMFQQGGRLWALELPAERLHEIKPDVPDDGAHTSPHTLAVGREARPVDVAAATDYALSPDGERAVFAAHGDLFSLTLDGSIARDVTATPAVDEDHPAVSPDGLTLAYVTEAAGAQQIAVRSLSGGPERRLTRFQNGVFYTPLFSPDGNSLAVASAEHELWLVPLSGETPRRLAFDPAAEIRDAAFSPEGRWLAFSTLRATGVSALHLYDLRSGRDQVVGSPLESDRLPTFSADGRAFFFVSKRNELPFVTDRGDETTLSTLASDGIYGVALDERGADNLLSRAVKLPVAPGRIVSLETRGSRIVYETRPPALLGGELPGSAAALHAMDPADGKDQTLVSGLDSYVSSADGRHVLFVRDAGWRVLDLANGREQAVDLAGLSTTVDPHAEWREMFEHAWRLDRDLFFNPTMNGSNWNAVHDAYVRLLPLLGSRSDFLYLLGQLQGELATSHAFISGLDADDGTPALHSPRLGADLTLDVASSRYRIARIYAGDPTRDRFRSPLNAPTLGGSTEAAKLGDYLLAIDGKELKAPTDPDRFLLQASGPIELSLASRLEGSRRTLNVSPLTDDLGLRQHDWIDTNRRHVEAVSHGRIGYIFLPDFNAVGSEELFRQLQGQLDKEGLVIDVRWNRGGFTSQAVLELLKRVRAGIFVNRERAVTPLPLFTSPRAMAVVINAESASDGDQFAYFFKAESLGPAVGERTWGGVQGIRGPWPLMDGTAITIPKDSLASLDGRWLIENVGVEPDIPVDREPDEFLTGRDSQLDAAVQAVLAKLTAHPSPPLQAPPPLPAYPEGGQMPGSSF